MSKIILFLLFIVYSSLFTQSKKELLIRCDDIGMCNSVNRAAELLIQSGIKFSASVMFACPWYQEAIKILKDKPNVSVGIHLTLNSEWKNFRWGPTAGWESVPSLTDSNGFFLPSRKTFNQNNPKLQEIEKEFRAQIKRAMNSGLKIDYMDYHMGTAVETLERREIVEKLAKEFNLGISRYFGEVDIKNVYDVSVENKAGDLINNLSLIKNDTVGLLVCHIGLDSPEMRAMEDMNVTGLKEMSKHRQAELDALTQKNLKEILNEKNIVLVNYSDLIGKLGISGMKRPD